MKKRRKEVEKVEVIMKEPRRRESRAMASERRQADVKEERAKRKREEDERKEERREAKKRREESWRYMLRHPKQGGSNLRVAIRVGPKALDKIADGREGWIGQGSAGCTERGKGRGTERHLPLTGGGASRIPSPPPPMVTWLRPPSNEAARPKHSMRVIDGGR